MVVVASNPPLELSPSSSHGVFKNPPKMASFFKFRAPPSLKQLALTYGVILALDFMSNG